MSKKKNRVILASASPRRKQLLEQMGLHFEVIVSDLEEKVSSSDPAEVVKELSGQKAGAVADLLADHADDQERLIVIGSDTVVACDGRILGKPVDEQHAFDMLNMLQGRMHQVYTGVTVIVMEDGDRRAESFACCTDVSMYPVSEAEIWDYIAGKEPMDKAGAYGIQGKASIFIEGIRGDYNNVVGLPVSRLYQVIKKYL